jgi:hypothetical protein
MRLMPYYAETGDSRLPNHLTFTDNFIAWSQIFPLYKPPVEERMLKSEDNKVIQKIILDFRSSLWRWVSVPLIHPFRDIHKVQ